LRSSASPRIFARQGSQISSACVTAPQTAHDASSSGSSARAAGPGAGAGGILPKHHFVKVWNNKTTDTKTNIDDNALNIAPPIASGSMALSAVFEKLPQAGLLLIDPGLVDQTVQAFQRADPPVDFAANRLPRRRTYPIGLDTEVCSMAALEQAWRQAAEPHQREHVMPFFYENPDRFRSLLLDHEEDLGDLRWTVDTPEDLALVQEVYRRMAPRTDFGWLEVLHLIRRNPDLAAINVHVEHRTERDVEGAAPPSEAPRSSRGGS